MTDTSTAPIKVGIVGLGRSGWHIHVARLRDDKRFMITAVSDRQAERCQEAAAAFGSGTYTDLNDLLNDADCELIVIASQSVDHATHSVAASHAGFHALVEKPMAMSTLEATRMIEAAKSAGKKLFVHHNYRYSPDVRHIQEIVQSGLLGRIFEIRIRNLTFSRRNDWQTLRKYGGGTLNNTCPHFIDTALLLLNAPVNEIFTDVQLTTDVGDADDHVKILLKGENGRVIDLEVSTSCAFEEPKWTILGTSGTLRSDGITSEVKFFDPRKLRPLEVIEGAPEGRTHISGDQIPWEQLTRPSLSEATSDFYDNVFSVIRNGAPMDIPPEQALAVIQVTERALRGNEARDDGAFGQSVFRQEPSVMPAPTH